MTRKFQKQSSMLMRLRSESGLTLREISDKTGINITKWFRLENGKVELRVSDVLNIETAFQVDIYKELKNGYENILPSKHVSPFCA